VAVFLGTAEQPGAWGGRSGSRSPHTTRAYAYALSEFFEFLAHWKGRVVPPHEVTRRDASDYVEWLSNRGSSALLGSQWNFSIRAEKLKDGDHAELLAVYDTVKALGGSARLQEIARALPASVRLAHPPNPVDTAGELEGGLASNYAVNFGWITGALRQLLFARVLERTPTIAELRQVEPDLGIFSMIDPEKFVYSCPKLRPVSQATINLRVQALSSFWRVLQRGENVSGEAALKYNIFEEVTARTSRGLRREQRERRKDRLVTPAIMRKLLLAAHGTNTLTDTRNAALLWFLLLTGARVEEAVLVRRGTPLSEGERNQWPGWLDLKGTPPSVMLLRKGNLKQRIVMPRTAIRAIELFWVALRDHSDNPRHRLLAEEPDAPLFPPLNYWGQNHGPSTDLYGRAGYRKPMSTSNVRMLLKRLADDAQLTPEERRRVHPHAFRHAAAGAMVNGGKDIREVQSLLNHESITTTEGYLPTVDQLESLTGEAEVISWLREGVETETEMPSTGIERRSVETVAEPTPPEERKPKVVEATFEEDEERSLPAAHQLPIGPPVPPYPKAALLLAAPGSPGLSAIGEGPESPPWPAEPYEALARGKKPPDIAWSGTPQSKWLAAWYPSLPARFGIGKESLLLWHNPQAPLPLPVLSPDQVYPELELPGSLLERLELLYDDWRETQPTATLALARWLQYFGSQTVGLESALAGDYAWAAFGADAETGAQLREHDTEWVMGWFKANAHTFTQAQRAFESVTLAQPGESSEEFWQRTRTDMSTVAAIPAVPALPEYFAERDPTHAIYVRSPDEWVAFARWLRRLTGDSDVREQNREEQLTTEEQKERSKREQVRGLLEYYYLLVDETKEYSEDSGPAQQMQDVARTLQDLYQVKVPKSAAESGEGRAARITALVDKRFPQFAAPPVPAGNVLGDSRMFQPEWFSIDDSSHTLVHAESIKRSFAAEHDGRDSECVMRRVARAIWEHVREWEYAPARTSEAKRKRASRSELRKQLFVIQLAVMSYVVPCEPELERMLNIHSERPIEVTRRLNEEIRRAALGEPSTEGPEVQELAWDVAFSEYAIDPMDALEAARDQQRADKFFAAPQSAEEQALVADAERERKRAARERYRANARLVLPHPLRLVAATYWPV
jgi:site-specific recombinase XerD